MGNGDSMGFEVTWSSGHNDTKTKRGAKISLPKDQVPRNKAQKACIFLTRVTTKQHIGVHPCQKLKETQFP